MFLGLGENEQNDALALAATCDHPEARWLCKLFEGGLPDTLEEMEEVFRKDNTAIGHCFAALMTPCTDDHDPDLLELSAEMGCVMARFHYVNRCPDEFYEPVSFWRSMIKDAAAQHDVNAMCMLAEYYRKDNPAKAAPLYNEAAELGHAEAQYYHGLTFSKTDQRRYYFWKKAIKGQHSYDIPERLADGRIPREFVFDLGAGFKHIHIGHYDEQTTKAVQDAIAVYDSVCEMARTAVYCWTLIAKQFKQYIARDVAKIIGKMLLRQKDEWKPKTATTEKKARN